MSAFRDEVVPHVSGAAAKLAVGPGVTAVGLFTLNDMALVMGILASLAIFLQTTWRLWTDVQDRRARKAAEAKP